MRSADMPSRLAERCAAGIARSIDVPLSALLNPPLQSPQQTGVLQETANGAFSLKRFSRFHSVCVFVCFVCLGFLFCFVSYCYFWPTSNKLTQISPKDQRRKKRKIPAMRGSLYVGKESPTASAAAFATQGRDTTASTVTIQLVRKVWRCWWLHVGNGPTDTGFMG